MNWRMIAKMTLKRKKKKKKKKLCLSRKK